jgi:hypothetical protein
MILQWGFAPKGRAQASSPTRREKKRTWKKTRALTQGQDNVRNSGGCSEEGGSPLVNSGADGTVNGGGGGGDGDGGGGGGGGGGGDCRTGVALV